MSSINTSNQSNPLDPLNTLYTNNTKPNHKQPKLMHLKLYVCDGTDSKLYNKYQEHILKHNTSITNPFFDSGFDLFNPNSFTFGNEDETSKYDLRIQTAAFDSVTGAPMPFYVYPRSSIYKTPLRLSNSVGIIDSGYRGNICALFDKKSSSPSYTINEGARLLQICAPDLRRVHIQLVNKPEDLGQTQRGTGGFGSTGN
jgi:dUTP pyrophosphatase